MTIALMWEARAVPGRGEELLAWAGAQELAVRPLRRESFRAPQDRVLVITWWDAPYDAELPELPEPDGGLVTRAVHRWRFESVAPTAEEPMPDIARILEGARVVGVGRAADMGVLELAGPQGEALAIHLQCPFRIVWSGRLALGSRDMRYDQRGAGPDAFERFATVYDERTGTLNEGLAQDRPTVTDVTVGPAGALTVTWDPEFRLEAFPDCSGTIEAWRVLVRGGEHHGYPPGTV